MKQIAIILLVALTILSCGETKNQEKEETIAESTPQRVYPVEITSVFDAHGGIQKWNAMNNLCFTLEKEEGNEVHTVDLKSRKARIETENYTLGFDGEKVWLAQDSTYFQPERARFYHNLMFYFYAMPFVLGDEGIAYSDVDPLTVGDVSYPGTKISFGDGVGDAPDDEYILYRDPKTNQMAWLAYTVTYGKNEKSDRFSFIKYADWQEVNGLQLPKTLEWYALEDGVPTTKRSERTFTKPTATATELEATIFEKPQNGKFVE
ncbi:hypothetical protein EAX61_01140 [Dokdonia sinensis]|uniref:Threonine synthase n=1 Tax=Dokdonia sinensis TaxID=2479847 RepID=A0A3M0H2Y0_9FLAO|nr:DUF6503 family protein [Dokdonia sinensis]RMB64016.1 hypothetical protein EAX61_01140 [Dokdonia sinensis]